MTYHHRSQPYPAQHPTRTQRRSSIASEVTDRPCSQPLPPLSYPQLDLTRDRVGFQSRAYNTSIRTDRRCSQPAEEPSHSQRYGKEDPTVLHSRHNSIAITAQRARSQPPDQSPTAPLPSECNRIKASVRNSLASLLHNAALSPIEITRTHACLDLYADSIANCKFYHAHRRPRLSFPDFPAWRDVKRVIEEDYINGRLGGDGEEMSRGYKRAGLAIYYVHHALEEEWNGREDNVRLCEGHIVEQFRHYILRSYNKDDEDVGRDSEREGTDSENDDNEEEEEEHGPGRPSTTIATELASPNSRRKAKSQDHVPESATARTATKAAVPAGGNVVEKVEEREKFAERDLAGNKQESHERMRKKKHMAKKKTLEEDAKAERRRQFWDMGAELASIVYGWHVAQEIIKRGR